MKHQVLFAMALSAASLSAHAVEFPKACTDFFNKSAELVKHDAAAYQQVQRVFDQTRKDFDSRDDSGKKAFIADNLAMCQQGAKDPKKLFGLQ